MMINMTPKFTEYVYSIQETVEALVTYVTAILPDRETPQSLIDCAIKTQQLLAAVIEEGKSETARLQQQLKILETAKQRLSADVFSCRQNKDEAASLEGKS